MGLSSVSTTIQRAGTGVMGSVAVVPPVVAMKDACLSLNKQPVGLGVCHYFVVDETVYGGQCRSLFGLQGIGLLNILP